MCLCLLCVHYIPLLTKVDMMHHGPDYQVYYKIGWTIPGPLTATASEITVYSHLLMTGWAHCDIKNVLQDWVGQEGVYLLSSLSLCCSDHWKVRDFRLFFSLSLLQHNVPSMKMTKEGWRADRSSPLRIRFLIIQIPNSSCDSLWGSVLRPLPSGWITHLSVMAADSRLMSSASCLTQALTRPNLPPTQG